jgi:hypothetical protein
MGKAGDSFNDIITHLIKGRYHRKLNNEKLLLQSDLQSNQTVAYPERHNASGGMFNE